VKDPGQNDDDGLSPTARAQRSAAPYINAAWKVAGGVAVGALAGGFVDGKLHSGPWGLLVGLLVGMGAGFYGLFRALTAMGRKQ
jgi:ATP synthase protein I